MTYVFPMLKGKDVDLLAQLTIQVGDIIISFLADANRIELQNTIQRVSITHDAWSINFYSTQGYGDC